MATVASLPPQVANSVTAGSADLRLRIAHRITHVTLHHTGDSRPLLPGEDPIQRLRGLQAWGATDRNWWDVPYHFLLDLEGRVFEGRDYHYMGETNTTYDPGGIGNPNAMFGPLAEGGPVGGCERERCEGGLPWRFGS
ncbi:MAG: hypothetical protein ACRENP_23985, partial [Longimicrobiales bacterium]